MKLEISPPAHSEFGKTLIQEAEVRRIDGFHYFQHYPINLLRKSVCNAYLKGTR